MSETPVARQKRYFAFRDDVTEALNKHGMCKVVPDIILAQYLLDCLKAYERTL